MRLQWLSDEGNRRLARAWAADEAQRPRDWADSMRLMYDSRYDELVSAGLQTFAREAGTTLLEPLRDPRFTFAMARVSPRDGLQDRTAVFTRFFGDLLPDYVLSRTGKAAFTEVFWGPEAAARGREYAGEGIDPALIDLDGLRWQWTREVPDFTAFTALQASWLATNAR
jgi:hypothetical protein